MILEDQIVQFENNSQPTQAPAVFEHTRPDLCVIDYATRMCLIVDVLVPFGVFVNDCYQTKFNPYFPLCQVITEKGYDCKIILLTAGSLSSVHWRFVSGWRLIDIPTSRAKRMAKYCSVTYCTAP